LKRLASLCLIVVVIITALFLYGKVTTPPAATDSNSSPQPATIDLSSLLQDRVAVYRLQPTDASRLYGYSLLAADGALTKYKGTGDDVVAATAGGLVALNLLPNPTMKAEIGSFFLRHGVKEGSKFYKEGKDVADKVLKIADLDHYNAYIRPRSKPHIVLQNKLSKNFKWVPTGTGDGPLDPAFADINPVIPSASSCSIPSPTDEEVASEGEAMYKSFDPKAALGKDVLYWLAGVGTSSPSGYWLRIAGFAITDYHINKYDASHLLAEMAISDYDAGILTWDYKYSVDELRPETFWKLKYGASVSILPRDTPNHPSYPSGHSAFSQAAATILIRYIGNNPIRDVLPPDLYAGTWKANWPSPQAAVSEASLSRIHAGFHYPMDTKYGQVLGGCIGYNTLSNFDTMEKGL